MSLVDVGLLQTLSYVAAAIGVCVAAAYYVMTLRNQSKTRQAQLFMQIHAQWRDRAFIKRFFDVLNIWEWNYWEDFWAKYGQVSNEDAFITVIEIAWYFEGVGQLLRDGLIDIRLVDAMYSDRVIRLWEKSLPIVVGLREMYRNPDYYGNYEYLYNELKKRHVTQ